MKNFIIMLPFLFAFIFIGINLSIYESMNFKVTQNTYNAIYDSIDYAKLRSELDYEIDYEEFLESFEKHFDIMGYDFVTTDISFEHFNGGVKVLVQFYNKNNEFITGISKTIIFDSKLKL